MATKTNSFANADFMFKFSEFGLEYETYMSKFDHIVIYERCKTISHFSQKMK